ncbi:MAG TPA: hypothetical protein VNL38_04445 [Candidatus Nitrosotenuis sp.]|nr:hypothetical protein [Candidatus Nitrosotenuis sp.]
MRYALFLLAVCAAYAIGYWPEHKQLAQVRGDLRAADRELADLRGRLRITKLENILVQALDRAARQEYDGAKSFVQEFSIELSANLARPDMRPFETRLRPLVDKIQEVEHNLERKDNAAARDGIRGLLQDINNIIVPPSTSDLPAVLRTPSGPTP